MSATGDNDDIQAMNFEAALAELERIVENLERGDVPLDQSIAILRPKQCFLPRLPKRKGRPTQVPLTTRQPKLSGSSSDAQNDAVASLCGESCEVMCASVKKVPFTVSTP